MTDVLVVGAGLAGASVAWHLRDRARVTVVERAAQPGTEASSQNAGMIRRLGEDPYERALAVRTHAWLADPPPEFSHASRRTGAVLGLAVDPHWLSDGVAHLKARGIEVSQVDRLDEIAPALVGSRLQRAWYLPDERVGDAHALVTGFLRGADVRYGVEVERLAVEGGRVVGVQTSEGPLVADVVVLAAGAWSGALAAWAGLARPLIPIRRTLLQTDGHALSRADHPWCWVDDVGVYVRPEGTGWLVSGCDEAVDPPVGGGSRGPVEPEARALAIDKLERWFPALGEVRFSGGWTGLRTFAPDRRPVLGSDPELDGLWWAAGLGGFGVTTCFAVGECVATWLTGGEVPYLRPRGVSPGRDFPRRWAIRPDGSLSGSELVPVSSPGSARSSGRS